MKTLILHDARGQPVNLATLQDVQPVEACDVDFENDHGTIARDAKSTIQTILKTACEDYQTIRVDAPHDSHEFVIGYCRDRGVRVSLTTGPQTHEIFATIQRVV